MVLHKFFNYKELFEIRQNNTSFLGIPFPLRLTEIIIYLFRDSVLSPMVPLLVVWTFMIFFPPSLNSSHEM